MKIGILTFHSQLNYGGVLQALALQFALMRILASNRESAVRIVDRWIDPSNCTLERGFDRSSILDWMVLALKIIMGLGFVRYLRRIRRTKLFIRQNLKLTQFHFCEWKEFCRDFAQEGGFLPDLLVVGSDQVWNPNWSYTRFYLCEGTDIPRISYAASMGVKTLTCEQKEHFKVALCGFRAVSCREIETCRLLQALGVNACHVVDPTLLVNKHEWLEMLRLPSASGNDERRLVCYFLRENVEPAFPVLQKFAKEHNAVVEVFPNDAGYPGILPFPKDLNSAKKWILGLVNRIALRRVKLRLDAGPLEYVSSHATATWIVTDSFHSLMFASIFGRNCRVLAPHDLERRGMFSRIEEFASHYVGNGCLVQADLSSALSSFSRGETACVDAGWLEKRRQESLSWLRSAINA